MLIRFGDSPNLSQFGLLCNTEDAGLFSNVSAALKLGLPEVELYKPTSQPAVICGGGPSLADTLVNIRALKAQGARIFALNNTAKFLTEHGIRPDCQIIVDPRPQDVVFIEKAWSDELLLSSQCHPAMFAQAREIGYPVRVWHPGMKGIDEIVTSGPQVFIGGGMTVGLSGACVVCALGHREIHLFGYDSSHRRDHSHAYAQPMNAGEEMVVCAADNQVFECSMAMAAQANDFKGVADGLIREGCSIHVHGEGLLPTLWRSWMREETERILTAVFDLGISAPEDFASFLDMADAYRVAGKYDQMDLVFEPGPIFGFRNDNAPQNLDALKDALWFNCVGRARHHPAVRNIEIMRRRRTIAGDVFPHGYAENAPKSHYEAVQLKEKTS